jgi:hypothetical protein
MLHRLTSAQAGSNGAEVRAEARAPSTALLRHALNASCSGPVESPKGVRRAGRKAEGPHAARAALLLDLVLLL